MRAEPSSGPVAGTVGILIRVLLKTSDVAEQSVHVVSQLPLFELVEGRYLLELYVKCALEDTFGVLGGYEWA